MRRLLIAALAWLLASPALAQVPYFPQTLPPSSVVGNILATPAPTQAITLSNLASAITALQPTGGKTLNIVTQFGADPTGVVPVDTAFNNAMAACYGGFNQYPQKGTVYIPAGTYTITSGLQWKQNCNILADYGAYFKVTASIPSMLKAFTGVANTLAYGSWLQGGQWDCNNLVTNDGFVIPDFAELLLTNFWMYNCNSGAGGFIHLGSGSALQQFSLNITYFHLFNFGGTKNAGNQGIFTDNTTNNPHGVTDSHFSYGEVVGTDLGMNMNCSNCRVSHVHNWLYASQGSQTNGFSFFGFGPVVVEDCQVDSPIASGNPAYRFNLFSGAAFATLTNSGFLEAFNDNFAFGAEADSGTTLVATSNTFRGSNGSLRVKQDYTGTGTITVIGQTNTFVVTTALYQGLANVGANTMAITANGNQVARFFGNANGTNQFQFNSAPAASTPSATCTGTDTNINCQYWTTGTGGHFFGTNVFGSSGEQFVITNTSSAVNNLAVTGNTTGNPPTLFAQGSDTNVNINFAPQGTGVLSIGGTLGVTCSGTPTASFASTKGLVTHC